MTLEDTRISEVHCSECNRPISSIPSWLATATVKFQCEECRQKHPRIPGMADLDPRRGITAVDELGELDEVAEPEDEVEEEAVEEAEDYAE